MKSLKLNHIQLNIFFLLWALSVCLYACSDFTFKGEKSLPSLDADNEVEVPTSNQAAESAKEFSFDYVSAFSEGLARVRVRGKWGYIDTSRTLVIPIFFHWANNFHEGMAAVELEGGWGFINQKGAVVIPLEYDWVDYFKGGLAIFKKDGREGFLDKKGNIVVPPHYNFVERFQDSLTIVKLYDYESKSTSIQASRNAEKEKWGLINKRGEEVTPLKYAYISQFRGKTAKVMLIKKSPEGYFKKQLGLIDRQGKELCPIQYQILGDFHNGLATACKDSSWGYINTEGKEITSFQYDKVFDFSEQIGRVHRRQLEGFIDVKGREITPLKYHFTEDFKVGFARVAVYGNYGVINSQGKEIIPTKYETLERLGHGIVYLHAHNQKSMAVINKEGKLIVKANQYDTLWYLRQGIIQVQDAKSQNYGFIYKANGKIMIPIKYNHIDFFKRGIAKVQVGELWGGVNREGEEIIPILYQELYIQDDGIALGKLNGAWKYMLFNEKGEIIIPQDTYDEIAPFQEGMARVKRNGKFGFIDSQGNELIAPKFTQASAFRQGQAQVQLDQKIGYINKQGKVTWNP